MKLFQSWRSRLGLKKLALRSPKSGTPLDTNDAMRSALNVVQGNPRPTYSHADTVSTTILRALSEAGLMPPAAAPETQDKSPEAAAAGIRSKTAMQDSDANRFLARSLTNAAGTRAYRLYVPRSYAAQAAQAFPLIVMLHGCTQTPEDFAVGTQMNALAECDGFLVLYPAQSPNANGAKCWNWFRPEDQRRDAGEPSLIADMTREVMKEFRVDARRIFVAGLSAGAAMAVILGETYPELYAGIGVHSGLPYAAAHDAPSAFQAMRSGPGSLRHASSQTSPHIMPTIVFHGDKDHTVAEKNGAAVFEQAVAADASFGSLTIERNNGEAGGRSFAREIHRDGAGHALFEYWRIGGAGHAWSGGDKSASHTDARGINASAEMLRFFFALPRTGAVN